MEQKLKEFKREAFEQVEKHLYKRQYQSAGGDWTTLYYRIFVDWKKVRRKFPLGSNLGRARNKLGEYRRKNAEFDFDRDKADREVKAMTFSKWTQLHEIRIRQASLTTCRGVFWRNAHIRN